MHARIRQKLLTASLTTKLSADEKAEVERLARERRVTPSEYVRMVVVDTQRISAGHRLILAEICATRRQTEALLRLISDLNDRDISRARSDADLLRPTLVEQRLLELKRTERKAADA
jgi:hypothetical protein